MATNIQVEILGRGAKHRANNTIAFTVTGHRSDFLLPLFDLEGLDLSAGAACSSGSGKPSHVAMAMGRPEEMARCGLRISFSPFIEDTDFSLIESRLALIFRKI